MREEKHKQSFYYCELQAILYAEIDAIFANRHSFRVSVCVCAARVCNRNSNALVTINASQKCLNWLTVQSINVV